MNGDPGAPHLVRVSVVMAKLLWTKATLRVNGSFQLPVPQHSPSLKEVRTVIPRGQKPEDRSQCRGHGDERVLLTGLLSFLSFLNVLFIFFFFVDFTSCTQIPVISLSLLPSAFAIPLTK